MLRLGVVSFLNACPLVSGLVGRRDVACRGAVPARLGGLLEAGAVDVALLPIVDVLRSAGRYAVVSDACIACDGVTMTVRVFSQKPPAGLTQVWADTDSHTSVVLARVLWRELHGHDLELCPLEAGVTGGARQDAVLLIGDKVVAAAHDGWSYEVDLGSAWRDMTGLPFVFAVWAVDRGRPEHRDRAWVADVEQTLGAARDEGLERLAELAREEGPPRGWPVELAEHYLARCMRYKLDERYVAGAERFAVGAKAVGAVAADARIEWPSARVRQGGFSLNQA